MDEAGLLKVRLRNTGLTAPFKTAAQAVSALGAVQSQDYHAAKWSLGLRVRGATDASIEKAFDAGEILRTHVLRPTWHFVTPKDIRWMLALSAQRVRAKMAHYNRKLKLDAALFSRSNAALAKAARGGSHPTRQELKKVLEGVGIETDVQRLAHILMEAELDAVLCSGPRDGKQFTYALLDERAPKARPVAREEAMARLALMYFKSHGPAQLADFAWWSGLSGTDAAQALESIHPKLAKAEIAGKTYWRAPSAKSAPVPRALLLSLYDEYVIAYADRGPLSQARDIERMIKMGNALTSVIILDGKLAGTWKRVMKKGKPVITLSPFRKPTKAERDALEDEMTRCERFLAGV